MTHNPENAASDGVFATLSMERYLLRHQEWSWKTFGSPADRKQQWEKLYTGGIMDGVSIPAFAPSAGVVDHIRKELVEIEKDPTDFTEWLDVIILGIDGYLRAGGSWKEFLIQLFAKQRKNFNRTWPDWKKTKPGVAIEHAKGTHD